MGKNLWRRLKGRIYYYVCGCIVRLFHPSIWKLAEDLEQFYEDYHPWGHEDGMSHLPEDGLSPDMASAVLYSAVDIWRWKHEHDKQVSEMIADLDDSELIERGKDILQRLLLYRKDRKGKRRTCSIQVVFAKATFDGDATTWSGQEGIKDAEIIHIGRWHICAAINIRQCVVEYNQPDLLERLRSYGYKITQETRIFEVDGDSFNPMEFTRYEHDIGDLFMFHGLAVNVDRWNGIKTLCKRNLSLNDATREWNLEDAVEVASYSIPNDKLGELALKINDLRFDVWSEHYQAPGESEDLEERLDDLSYLSDRMKKGISPVDDLEELKEDRSLLPAIPMRWRSWPNASVMPPLDIIIALKHGS